jgi:DNA-binding LacI/PurR family transcriptional regulator
MKSEQNGPSITDVARAASVSVATVSRVLTGKDNVADPVRSRVLETVKKLNYRPLRRSKQSAFREANIQKAAVAYVFRDPARRGGVPWAPAFAAASQRLQGLGHSLQLHNLGSDGAAPLPERTGAMLAIGAVDAQWIAAATASGMPAVRVSYFQAPLEIPQVVTDSFAGGLRLMEHLIKKGHRRIAIWRVHAGEAAGPQRNLNEREKYAAYRFALDEAGIEFKKSWEVDMPFQWPQIEPCAQKLLAINPAPSAVFVDNSWVTNYMLRYPGGKLPLPANWHRRFEFAHWIDSGHEPTEPGMSSVAIAMDEMGALAAELLLDALSGRRCENDLVIKVPPRFFTAEQASDLAHAPG